MEKFRPTPEQKKSFKGMYFISEQSMVPLDDSNTKVTANEFKALWIDGNNELQELNVNDFNYYDPKRNDFDFRFAGFNMLLRSCMPDDIVELFEKNIQKEM